MIAVPALDLMGGRCVQLRGGVPEDERVSLPDPLAVGMGVVDVRSARLQSVVEIQALGAAGAKVLSPGRIALNPDCGFAPDAGEPPTVDEAYEKLKRMVAAAANLRATLST